MSMRVNEEGKTSVASLVHPSNVLVLITEMLLDKVTLASNVHPAKAYSLIVLTLLGIVMVVRADSLNALAPIVDADPKSTLANDEHA